MNCEQNLVILRINKRCEEVCLAQTPLYFVDQFVFICSAIKPLSIGMLARKNYLPTQNVIKSLIFIATADFLDRMSLRINQKLL